MSVFIIAEAGVNHNGDIQKALALIDAAVEAGADAVKFQTFKADALVSKTAKQAEYQAQNTGKEQSQYELLKTLELSESEHQQLVDYCQQRNIEFMSTAFDNDSIELLKKLGMRRWKIPSGELLSVPYLRKIASLNQPTILSTGMGNLSEVEFSIKTLLEAGLVKSNLTILHANTAYPTPYKDVNLRAMQTLAQEFEVPIGLSDHSLGIEVPIAAVALDATVIEKHFTLDKMLPGPDHKASLEPDELKAMVQSIRHIELAMGTGIKSASASESKNKKIARKRIVAARNIKKGEKFTEDSLRLQRANEGVFSQCWDQLLQLKAQQDYQLNDPIMESKLILDEF